MNRRNFISLSSIHLISFVLATDLLAKKEKTFSIESLKKVGLKIHNSRPINLETYAHFLDDDVTPYKHLFIRNNGVMPDSIDIATWRLEISGESVKRPYSFSMNELKKLFNEVSYQLVIECGGNGRAEYQPSAKGNQWGIGAVGCPKWTGIRLRDILEYCGIKEDAEYIGFYGLDKHLSGNEKRNTISRGCPIDKALQDETILAYEMNGEVMPFAHGYPMRLVVPGYPGSVSGKWLKKIKIRNRVHDGEKMNGYAYRVPCNPVEPGTHVEKKDMCIIEEMPAKSLISSPQSNIKIKVNEGLAISGHAWSGNGYVKRVDISTDFGVTWHNTNLQKGVNIYAWQRFEYTLKIQKKGYYEVWARATDNMDKMQPVVLPGWNPKGYLNNACHRIVVTVI